MFTSFIHKNNNLGHLTLQPAEAITEIAPIVCY